MVIVLSAAGPEHAPLRERLAGALAGPRAPSPPSVELLPVVTCHRVELFGVVTAPSSGDLASVRRSLSLWLAGGAELGAAFARAAEIRTGTAAHRRLLRLAAGLDSPVLGDRQIGGQVRRAFGTARANGTIGVVLDRLAQTALRAARRVRRETALHGSDSSVAAQAVAAAEARLGESFGGRCLVVGAGEVAAGVADRLAWRNEVELVTVNRTFKRAKDLASRTGGRAAPWDRMSEEIREARMIFLATSAPGPIIDAGTWGDTPLAPTLVLDLGMPRNAEPAIAVLAGVTLLDLSVVERAARSTAWPPSQAITKAESIVDAELAEFERWLSHGMQRRGPAVAWTGLKVARPFAAAAAAANG